MANQASFDINTRPADLSEQAARMVVVKYDTKAKAGKKFSIIPNIFCDLIKESEGLRPQSARFHYVLDGSNKDWPSQFEEIFALISDDGATATTDAGKKAAALKAARRKKYTVSPEDRICVLAYQNAKDKNDYQIYFDGFAEAPEVNVGPDGQQVTFDASGVGIRLYDRPIYQRAQQDSAWSLTDARHQVDGQVVFNPDGKPNCFPGVPAKENDGEEGEADVGGEFGGDGHIDGFDDVKTEDEKGEDIDDEPPDTYDYPAFTDVRDTETAGTTEFWTLERFARYMLGNYNDETFAKNPDFDDLKDVLKSKRPKEGEDYFDPADPDTYDETDIRLVEFDATGKRWPDALQSVLAFNGFGAKFDLATEGGLPVNTIEVYRKDGTGIVEPKEVYFQQTGQALDPAKTNTQQFHVTRDYKNTYNAVVVDTKPELWEISVVLAPGFEPAAGDELKPARDQFLKSMLDAASGVNRDKYRLYIADESGEGHWEYAANKTLKVALDLSGLFPDDDDGDRTYSRRRRPGKANLNTLDDRGKPLKAQLHISTDFNGESFSPSVWDGSGTWQPVNGGWELLKDRLGIRLTCEDPEQWNIGKDAGADPQAKSRTVRGVTAQANPSDDVEQFYLRLTTVIEGDRRPVPMIAKRKSSALKFDRVLYAHAKESYVKQYIAANSLYQDNLGTTAIKRDDTDKIEAFAAQLQQAHENPAIAGDIMIPHLDRGYELGDAISKVAGRNLSLLVNAGTDQGEAKRFPLVVSRVWNFGGRQTTTLMLSDHRADPAG